MPLCPFSLCFNAVVISEAHTFDTNREQTRDTRRKVEEFLKSTGSQMWIQHDMALDEKLKRAPEFID